MARGVLRILASVLIGLSPIALVVFGLVFPIVPLVIGCIGLAAASGVLAYVTYDELGR